jgi:hypothetical protein
MKKIIIGLMMMVCLCSKTWGQETMDVTLQWDANTESDLKGYGVHWDTDSGPPYGHHKDIELSDDENPDPAVVEYTLTGLYRGTMYFFSVDAFDTEDLRSGFSN